METAGPEARLDQLVLDNPVGRLLFVHMVLLGRLCERIRSEGRISHADALSLAAETVREYCSGDPGAESSAAAEILWSTIEEQLGPLPAEHLAEAAGKRLQ